MGDVLRSLDLIRVLLRSIPPRKDLLLPELGVIVKVQLGIHSHDLMIRRLRQRIDLDLRSVLVHENLVQLLNRVLGVLDALLREAQLRRDIPRDVVCHPLVDIDFCRDDGVGAFFGDGLDVHASLRRGDDDGALRLSVHQDGEVEFPSRKLPLADVHGVADPSRRAGLLGYELVPDHLVGEHLGFGGPVIHSSDHIHTP